MAALDPGRYDASKSTLYTSHASGTYPGYSPLRRYDRLSESTNGPAWALHKAPKGVPPPGCYDLKSSFGKPPPLPVRSSRETSRGGHSAPMGLVSVRHGRDAGARAGPIVAARYPIS